MSMARKLARQQQRRNGSAGITNTDPIPMSPERLVDIAMTMGMPPEQLLECIEVFEGHGIAAKGTTGELLSYIGTLQAQGDKDAADEPA